MQRITPKRILDQYGELHKQFTERIISSSQQSGLYDPKHLTTETKQEFSRNCRNKWVWEFLRRNSSYQEAWLATQNKSKRFDSQYHKKKPSKKVSIDKREKEWSRILDAFYDKFNIPHPVRGRVFNDSTGEYEPKWLTELNEVWSPVIAWNGTQIFNPLNALSRMTNSNWTDKEAPNEVELIHDQYRSRIVKNDKGQEVQKVDAGIRLLPNEVLFKINLEYPHTYQIIEKVEKIIGEMQKTRGIVPTKPEKRGGTPDIFSAFRLFDLLRDGHKPSKALEIMGIEYTRAAYNKVEEMLKYWLPYFQQPLDFPLDWKF